MENPGISWDASRSFSPLAVSESLNTTPGELKSKVGGLVYRF